MNSFSKYRGWSLYELDLGVEDRLEVIATRDNVPVTETPWVHKDFRRADLISKAYAVDLVKDRIDVIETGGE